MSFFSIEKEGASDRIVIALDSVEADFDTIDCGALNFISILIKEAKTKNPKCLRIGRQSIYDQCVIFASFFNSTVFSEAITFLTRNHSSFLATWTHDEGIPSITGSRGGGGCQDFNRSIWQGSIDFIPSFRLGAILCHCHPQLAWCEIQLL